MRSVKTGCENQSFYQFFLTFGRYILAHLQYKITEGYINVTQTCKLIFMQKNNKILSVTLNIHTRRTLTFSQSLYCVIRPADFTFWVFKRKQSFYA